MTPDAPKSNRWARLLSNSDLLFTFALFGIVVLLILPVPPIFLDLLLATSVGISLLILLVIVYVKNPPEFSIFPTILLAVTLFRLGLNVASTRLILLDGFAGNVIDAFGNFVVRGNFIVGAVIFLILVIVNFVVITKGSGRIAEVAARFTLDAMPGKQMAIDAELNAGMIDEVTAGERRIAIQKEADFYGAMDGASKFVRGDAVAGILITMINVIGGIAIGTLQRGLELSDALQQYVLLSIGDGLVSQIPGLIVSVAAGILVTRTSDGSDLGSHIGKTFTFYPRAIAIAGVMLLIFAILPGMPFLPFTLLAGLCFTVAYLLKKHGAPEQDKPALVAGSRPRAELESGQAGTGEGEEAQRPAVAGIPDFPKLIQVDTFAIELGYNLITLADKTQGGDLLDRVTGVRRNFAREMGLIVPPIAVRDNMELEANQYRFLLRNKQIAIGVVIPDRWMAMNVSGSSHQLKGQAAVEPVFNLEAVWIAEGEKSNAEIHGYTVVDAASVLITHLAESLKDHSASVLEREDTQKLIDLVKEKNPTLVNELLPEMASVGLIQRVLQNLLRERVPIRSLNLILETISDFASITKSPDDLAEQVRRRLGPYFISDYEGEDGIIRAITIEPRLEQQLVARVKKSHLEIGLMMDPALTQHLLSELTPRVEALVDGGNTAVVVTTTELRLAFRRFFEPSLPRMAVLAYQELPNDVQIQSHGILTAPPQQVAAPDPVNAG